MPATAQQRQSTYRQRLRSADKTVMRIVVSRDVANQLRSLARQRVESVGDVVTRLVQEVE